MTSPSLPLSGSARVFRNGRLADGRRVDLHVDAGRLTAVVDHVPVDVDAVVDEIVDVVVDVGEIGPPDLDAVAGDGPAGHATVDLGGRLVLAPMAEPHAHLDKALTADIAPNHSGDLMGAIDAWIEAETAGRFTHDDIVGRIRAALDRLLLSGVTAVRSHINVGGGAGQNHLAAALEAVAPYRSLMDIEFVSLIVNPTVGAQGAPNRAAMETALDSGIDLIGGCPHLEPDGSAAIGHALEWARSYDRRVDLHVDETLDTSVLTVREYARQAVAAGLEGRVTASHCVSLGMQTAAVQRQVAAEIAQAGMSVVTLPQTNLFLQGRASALSPPRGLTALHALLDAGVVVAAGADNVQDPFNLVGRSDPLETAALLVMAGHLLPADAYEMVSTHARVAMGLEAVRFRPGDPADFVAIAAPTLRAALADAPTDRIVVHAGAVVATTTTRRQIAKT